MALNKIILQGNLVRDPEVGTSSSGKTYAHYSIAVNRRYSSGGQDVADYFNIVSFDKAAEFVQKYFHKGSQILISGRLENNNYPSKKHPGETVYGFQIVTESIDFCGPKQQNTAQPVAQPAGTYQQNYSQQMPQQPVQGSYQQSYQTAPQMQQPAQNTLAGAFPGTMPGAGQAPAQPVQPAQPAPADGALGSDDFMNIPQGLDGDSVPFI